eukprot:TRINITY_DN11046_c0_g2_i1.p1 TRINITY_DN11046_c0_g2~~TRINITY_DN11046_c0_g2_i1.p1  ORF type:complete len:154 (-),score=15.62 TRINITY_DN11046_c0_g2_i1:35-496(-)
MILSLADGANFLHTAIRKGYESELILIGQTILDHKYFAGYQLGSIIGRSHTTSVSSFLHGIAAGFVLNLDLKYLVVQKFDNSTLSLTNLIQRLSLLNSIPYGAEKTVQVVLIQFYFDIRSITRTRPAEVSTNRNLSLISVSYTHLTLPTIYSV